MFEYLGTVLVDIDPGFDVLRYLTVRTLGGTVTGLLISILLGPAIIKSLKSIQFQQHVRVDGPESHYKKSGTPTMGGLLILSSLVISTLLWADLSNRYIWVVLFVTVFFALIGFLDDFLKIKNRSSDGLSSKQKILLQMLVSFITMYYLFYSAEVIAEKSFIVPFFKDLIIPMSAFVFISTGMFVLVGSSNAVNLTDGLDGLAILPSVLIAGALGLIAYSMGNQIIADYLYLPHLKLSGELIVFCGALIGSGIGFLWYNTYPAQIFMGDVGSLTLGAILGILAVILRHELVFAIMAGVFVIETLSVAIQVISYKTRGKRVFLMAPIHHHYELKGWPEPKIIVRFWIVTLVLILIALATLKLR
ncbi:MAG: phospho-N-acetylmuramoyl-pentapeptide-transferase [Proteobacteria bacterium]|jgi:phospho-N-acetylmuramoyl-pentapeptide-transferase|nr:phospho-N-acetylmuramoyl-pentapeptide-transferase [Pseudomonadota bacterium]NCX10442.1 phospho-N-acetylmuramoyl-pentapeptide-transferase [Pseudomonadota bacterium]NCX24327.1 phospho-N-acetylmuramoyl-pentapeptide-transferase [Pseudomonadota bacterium]NCX30093.1 phospho-N-acetylmuramoyl-pentapeptide-transferase [Pseudomonadota bacterium]NCX34046.1 phospho-N-acetylmuramoyl-pentapeptide-transferase [Pseudomonadota bacterium]